MLVMDSRTAYSRLVWLTPFSCRPVAQQFEMHLRARPLRTGSGRDDAGRPECGREPAFLSFLQFPPLTGLGYCRLASRRNAALAACARTALEAEREAEEWEERAELELLASCLLLIFALGVRSGTGPLIFFPATAGAIAMEMEPCSPAPALPSLSCF